MPATGAPIALCYGYNWITGQRVQYRTLQNTNNDHLDWSRVGFWLLGWGEFDGCTEMWDAVLNRLLYTSEIDDPDHFRFHPGCDADIGSGFDPVSTGGDQAVDQFFTLLPPGVQPLHYHRIAYYTLFLKQVINNPSGATYQNDPNAWTDINPVGLWRCMRCRIFDATGQMNTYAFTTNPAWQLVDVLLRRKYFPEYKLDAVAGPDDLTNAVRARFDWAAIADAAASYDTILANGRRKYEGNFAFAQQSSLQSVLGQILQCCRSFVRERNRQIQLIEDGPRASVFTMSRQNTMSFSANDRDMHAAANRYVAKFRDLLIPSAADVASISCPDHQSPTVTTVNPHPFAAADRIVIGGTDTKFDGQWVVSAVPATSSLDDDVYTMVLESRGSNYPAAAGAGGKIGLLYSRFKERAPEFNHHRNQYAHGAIGAGIPRQRNKLQLVTDFANCTFDQVARLSHYQRDRALGLDQSPYVPPVSAEVELPIFAADAAGSGTLAIDIAPGDRVTVDDTLDAVFNGDYEVLKATAQLTASSGSNADTLARSPGGGTLQMTLGPYSETYFYETSDPDEAGYDIVPNSDPGNEAGYTLTPLSDGQLAFFSTSGNDGSVVPIPSIGFNIANVLMWCSPQGYIEVGGQLHFIVNCDVDKQYMLHLVYSDGDALWHGDLNVLGIAWRTRNAARVFFEGINHFVELTLASGELICFGIGLVDPSAAVPIPPGYELAQTILLAFPKSASDTGNNAHGFRAYVHTDGTAHHDYYDGEGHHWEGVSHQLFFGWQNNMGTVTREGGWVKFPQPDGTTLCVGGFSALDSHLNGTTPPLWPTSPLYPLFDGVIPLPAGFTDTTLQVIPGTNSFQVVDHPAHGQKACYVDTNRNVITSFEDGEGNTWYGSSQVFAVLSDTPSLS